MHDTVFLNFQVSDLTWYRSPALTSYDTESYAEHLLRPCRRVPQIRPL